MEFNGENKRDYYRVSYPMAERPVLRTSEREYEVIDMSESGLKIHYDASHALEQGVEVRGAITLRDSRTLEIVGEIIRVNKRNAVAILSLHYSIPLSAIMSEQRYLINNYPGYK